MHAYMILCV